MFLSHKRKGDPPTRRYTLVQHDKYVEMMQQLENPNKKARDSRSLKWDSLAQSACMKGLSTGPHKRVGHLFEHFIVVGPSEGDGPGPEVEIRQPTLSFKFPNVALPTDHVVHFCFPHGVEAQQIIASQSMSTENEILYDSLKRIERSNSSYVFILNTNDGVLFGVCVRRKELHDVTPTFVSEPAPPTADSGEGGGNRLTAGPPKNRVRGGDTTQKLSTVRCYCLLSHFPFFELHFAVIYSILATERLLQIEQYRERSLEGEPIENNGSPKPVDTAEYEVGRNEGKKCKGSDHRQEPEDSSSARGYDDANRVIQMLRAYHEVQLTDGEEALSFTLPGAVQGESYACPVGDEAKIIAEWGVPCMCRMFSLTDFLFILRALLTELPIIVICDNLGVLSCIVLSLIPLLRPFVWQCTFIPILPANLVEILESPVPFIIGVQRLDRELLRTVSECLVIDCDTKTVVLPTTFPQLPFENKLRKQLKPIFSALVPKNPRSEAKAEWEMYPTRTSPTDKQAVQQLLHVLSSFHQDLMTSITEKLDSLDFSFSNPQHMTNLLKLWNKEEERQFFDRLLHTQMFAVFSDIVMKALWEKEIEQQETVLHQIVEMVSEEERQQAGIISVLNIYESLKEEDSEEKSRLQATLKQSTAKIESLSSSKAKVEAELSRLRSKLASINYAQSP